MQNSLRIWGHKMQTIPQYFGAYYLCPNVFNGEAGDYRNGQPILHGAPRLHYIKCSADVYYIRLAKDFIFDSKGEFICDTTVWTADDETNALNFMNGGDLTSFHPVTQMILGMDLEAGIDREDILESRAGIMMQSFLGFVPEHVFMVRPELGVVDEVEVEGETVQVPRFNPGSWYGADNPEFL